MARLEQLSVVELAVELMPAFGPEGPKGHGLNGGINILQVMAWKLSAFPRATKFMTRLQEPVREGLQALENAGLVLKTASSQAGTWWNATRAGTAVLTAGTVAESVRGG